ncbi:MAG: SHOCT domain-containing protein [Bacteroidales bacterium]
MHGFGGMGLGMGWGWIIGLFGIAVVIWLALRTTYQGRDQDISGNKSSLDILKERYARGEVDREEFEEKKKNLS